MVERASSESGAGQGRRLPSCSLFGASVSSPFTPSRATRTRPVRPSASQLVRYHSSSCGIGRREHVQPAGPGPKMFSVLVLAPGRACGWITATSTYL